MSSKPLQTALLCVLAISSCGRAQTCSILARPGEPDENFNAEYTQNGPGTGKEPGGIAGWTGADSTYSVLLPNGDSAFFFSDSYIGESPAASGDGSVTSDANGLRTRAPNCGPPLCNPPTSVYRSHNSIVIQSARTGILTTLTGSRDPFGYSTSYFTPATAAVTGHWYWMGDSVVVQTASTGTKKVWTFVMEFDSNFTYYGSAVAQLALPGLALESITPLKNVPLGNVVHWGTAMVLNGSFGNYSLYIYGIQDNAQNGRYPYVAMTNPGLGLAGVTDTNNWTVWNGSGWVAGLTNAARIIGAPTDPRNAGDFVSSEYSVKRIRSRAGTTYLLVAQDTKPAFGAWKDIVLYSACQPQGPFSAKQVVYSTPEAGSKKVPGMTSGQSLAGTTVTYNPHAHPQFNSNGQLLISYDLNAANNADLIYADTYRPKFIRVPIAGLK